MITFFSLHGFSQDANDGLEKMLKINPVETPEAVVEFKKVPVPVKLGNYAGLRFIDVRSYGSIGFAKIWKKEKQIVIKNGLAQAINANLAYNMSAPAGDSLLIFIRHFWETRIPVVNVKTDKEQLRKLHQAPALKPHSYCHVNAFYFVKNKDGLFYKGSMDSLLVSKQQLFNCYEELAQEAIGTLLNGLPTSDSATSRSYNEVDVINGLQNMVKLPSVTNSMPNGLFVTYSDFKKGKITNADISLEPRIDFYKLVSAGGGNMDALARTCWGACYNGVFYGRVGGGFCRLFQADKTFAAMVGTVEYDDNASPDINQSFLGANIYIVDPIAASKYRYKGHEFLRLLLNPITGYFE